MAADLHEMTAETTVNLEYKIPTEDGDFEVFEGLAGISDLPSIGDELRLPRQYDQSTLCWYKVTRRRWRFATDEEEDDYSLDALDNVDWTEPDRIEIWLEELPE